MTDVLYKVTDNLETTFTGLGLGDGTFAPVGRFAIGFVLGAGIMEVVRPSVAYNGLQRRPWAVTSPSDPAGTFLPWWGPGIVGGILFGVFI